MGFIPRLTCRRCGRQYSGLHSRCPYCGTRRVKSSDRVPSPTPAMNPGTDAARRAGTGTKWQMIFGAILLGAVILAVIPTATPAPTPTVTDVEITYYGEEKTDFSMNVGASTQLMASVHPWDVTAEVTWSISDETVATVDDTGLVTGVGAGTATITAESFGVSATCIVRVKG